jgi:hypothetical protein
MPECSRCGADDDLLLYIKPGGGGEMRCAKVGACYRRLEAAAKEATS